LWDKLSQVSYYTARGAGFKAKKPSPLDLTIREETRVKSFGTAEELEHELARIRGSA
jgi:hypothetical protein